MDEKEIKKSISEVITSSLVTNQYKINSKLSQLEQLYQVKRIGFTEEISDDNRALTKRIFGTGIRCLRKNSQQNQLPSSTNLVCLGYILLDIAFKDEYVLRLIIEQLHKINENLTKMLHIYNPYKCIGINVDSLQSIMIDIIIKINNWRNIFSMSDILRDYYLASEVYSIFLRIILCKVNYRQAENLGKYLDNTEQIYSILCDYFDLNVIAHRANSLRKHNKNNSKNPEQKIGDRAQVYLFSNYNLFVSTCDNNQFCCGRYYSNQSQLLNCQKQIRKSTLEYILKCQAKDEKSIEEEDLEENQDKFGDCLRLSQMELDLGLSSSGLVFSCQQETPYFNSNPQTPEFGELLDSARFRKSIDFQTALKLADNRPKQLQLGTVEQELNSPCSDGEKIHFMSQSNTKMFCQTINGLEQSLNFENSEAPKIHIFLKNKIQPKKQQDEDYCNKPRSPPSMQSSRQKQKNQHSLKHWDNSRELTFHKQLQSQNMSIEEPNAVPNKISIFDYNGEENQLNIPVIGKKSLLDGNSDLKSQSKLEYNDYDREYKEFVNMSVKESQHFIGKMEDNTNILNTNKKRDLNARKYSINEVSNNELKQLKKRQKDTVHHSNYFVRQDNQNDEQENQRNDGRTLSPQKQTNVVWQNAHSFNLAALRPSPKRMEFISNIVNVKLASPEKDKKYLFNGLKDPSSRPPLPKPGEELRNSKGKRQKSPRIRKELFSTLTKRLSDCEKNYKFNTGLNGSRKRFSNTPKQKSGDLISTIIIKDNQLKNSSKRSPRQGKQPSKFPEFLRNSKSRKGFNQNAQSGKTGHQIQTQSLKLQLKDLTLSKSAKSQYDKIESSLQNSQQRVKKHIKTSPHLQKNKVSAVSQDQANQQNQQQFQNKSKHTKSQPFLTHTTPTPELPNKNLVFYDTTSKPWQYFGSTSSGKIQAEYTPKYLQPQPKFRQGNYVSRQSFSSNEVPQKTRAMQYEQPFKNMTSQQYQNPSLKPEPYEERYLALPTKGQNFNDYAQIYPTLPQQPLVFNDNALQRTASFSARPQFYQAQRQIPTTYSAYTNNNTNMNNNKNNQLQTQNQNNETNPLELYYSTKTTYNRSPTTIANNFNTSSSMNLTPNINILNPMSSGFFHFNNSSAPPPIYASTPTRQKIQTASSSKVFSTKAQSPNYHSTENQFTARFQQFKYALKQESKK